MQILNLSPVLPVADLESAVKAWSALLGAAPRILDGDRWARFDSPAGRLALAGTDRDSDRAGVMIKVDDLAPVRAEAERLGLSPGPEREGLHERRFTFNAPGGWPVTVYASR
ncbi:MAG: VOC family protein [Caulobacteraceae bacterium]